MSAPTFHVMSVGKPKFIKRRVYSVINGENSVEEYRESELENKRTNDLMRLVRLIPKNLLTTLDVGARDGHFSMLLTECCANVTALDLEKPSFSHNNINCVQGDITNLKLSDNSFDLVFCTEVLEHIPSHQIQKACSELTRISKGFLLIGVPYKQDIRVGRTTCYSCGGHNPPWGHVNSFDRRRLEDLFPFFNISEISFIGETNIRTNFISTFLMDLAGNPYGTYNQEEPCIHCGKTLKKPPKRTLLQKIFTRAAFWARNIQPPFYNTHANWIHILFTIDKTKAT